MCHHIAAHEPEGFLDKVKKHPMNQDEAPPLEQSREANHTERIKSQVSAKIGRSGWLDHVEVSRHRHGNYRVNIGEQPRAEQEPCGNHCSRIRSSCYLKASGTGEILPSNPPLAKTAT